MNSDNNSNNINNFSYKTLIRKKDSSKEIKK